MKKLIIYSFSICIFLLINACDAYLDVELQNQMTKEEVFTNRSTAERYLGNVYSYLRNESDMIYNEGAVIPMSDEAVFSWTTGVPWLVFLTGSWNPTTSDYYIWTAQYTGINQATIFMDNIDHVDDTQLGQSEKEVMKAEARFLRAYFYFILLRKYGPVFIWGDQEADNFIKGEEIDRHTLDENVDFILSEYEKAIEILPYEYADTKWLGRITKGVAMAAKARLLLYMARPLFNGSDLYKGMVNKDGNYIFPQASDPEKWELAAQANKAVIDMNIYQLYESNTGSNALEKGINSYMGVMMENWNSEIIWGRWISSGFDHRVRSAPPRLVNEGYGGICPSLKLVDTYPMAESGRFPVTGYDDNGNPIIDSNSGYTNNGFTEDYYHPIDNYLPIKAHNSCVGRDARFYASVLANGMYWLNTFKGEKLVTFFNGGTSSYVASGDCVKVGFLWRKMFDPTVNHEENSWGTICWPYIRLAEIYLNYAEACNEKPNRNEAEALLYINKIRNRVGLNNIQEAYPNVVGNQQLLRELIRKERMVELAFECHRYYDVRTWMIGEQEFNRKVYTLDLLATNYEDSWNRTKNIWPYDMVFEPKHYFFPIHQNQLNEMKNFTQNYGW